MAVHTVSYTVEVKPAGSWLTVPSGAILDVSGSDETGGSDDNPFAFGESPIIQRTVRGYRPTLSTYAWERTPIRITTVIDSISAKSFTGIIVSYDGDDDGELSWRCESILSEVSARSRDLYSLPFINTAVATATTATSIEDPLNPNYAAGPINWGFWQVGGRPYEQAGSYPTADFYYSCAHAIAAPDVAWFAGEDGWQVMLLLAQASGGQIYQDTGGIVHYRQVLNIGSLTGSPSFIFADSIADATDSLGVYGNLTDAGTTEKFATKFVCSYTPRQLRATQQVLSDTVPRQIPAGGSITVSLEPQWPLRSIELVAPGVIATDKINVVLPFGMQAVQGAGGYDQVVTVYAQFISIAFTNNRTWPLTLRRIDINGEPWLAGEVGRVEIGSGTPQLEVVDNVFIQYEEQATQILGMHVAFAGVPHPVVSIENCPYDTRRYLGEIVYLTSNTLSILAQLYVIVGRNLRSIDAVDYKLAAIGNVPVDIDFFEIGTTNYTGLTKYVAW